MISLFLPSRAGTVQTLGHPAAGVVGWLDTSTNKSGIAVTKDSALSFAAVWCATRVIAETLGTLPCVLYRRLSDDGRERATDDPRYSLMHDEPHPAMSACTFFESMTAQMVLTGNCFARIRQDDGDMPRQLEMRTPDNVEINIAGNDLRYEVTGDIRESLSSDEMLHVAGLGGDGITGWSVVRYAAQSIGTGMAGEEYAAGMMGSGATPNGVIEHPAKLDKESRANLRREWNEIHKGSSKAGNIGIMHGGMKFQAVSMSAQDAQFLESREYSVREVARWFRLPPHMLADLADSSVRANIEQQAIEFIVYSMMPWLTRWQQALNRKLLDTEERKEKYFEFLLDSLLRGDAESRYRAYATGRQWGWFSINDIRRMENLNKIDDGDDYLTPANMQIVGDDPPAPQSSFPAPRRPEREQEEVPQAVVGEMQKNLIRSWEAIIDGGKALGAELAKGRGVNDAFAAADENVTRELASARSDRDAIRKELTALRSVQARGWSSERQAVIEACDDLLRSHMRCLGKVERSGVMGAARKVARGLNFVQWMDGFYATHCVAISDRIVQATEPYCRLCGVPAGLHVALAEDTCSGHQAVLLAACDGDRAGFVSRVQAAMANWDDDINTIKCEGIRP